MPNYAAQHQGISFGAVVFDMHTFEPIEPLYHEIKFDPKYKWELEAERVHGITREHLAVNGIFQCEAALDLANLIIKYFSTEKIVLLGHRVYFDEAFTNQLMASIDIELTYDPIRIDSAAMGLALLGTTTSDQLFERAGLPPRELHNSLEDICFTLEAVRRIKFKLI
jgi:DNA polymerase III epsilon subunit-like protein